MSPCIQEFRKSNAPIPSVALDQISSELDRLDARATLATLTRLSRTSYDVCAPHLWRKVYITRKNASLIFHGLNLPSARRSSPRIGRLELYSEEELEEEINGPFEESEWSQEKARLMAMIGEDLDRRKQRLLGYVERLVVETLPSLNFNRRLSDYLDLLRHQPSEEGRPLLHRCQHVTVQSPALMSDLDFWARRRMDDHLFWRILGQATPSTSHLCLSLPPDDDFRYKVVERVYEFQLSGNWTAKEQPASHLITPRSISPLLKSSLPKLRFQSITVHGVRDPDSLHEHKNWVAWLNAPTDLILFISRCQCHRGPFTHDCRDHIGPLSRSMGFIPLFKAQVKPDSLRSLCIIGAGLGRARDGTEFDEEISQERIQSDVAEQRAKLRGQLIPITFRTVAEGKPCVCCGQR